LRDDPRLALVRLAGRLMARVAHDLNNIAMVWNGHLDLVRGGYEEPAEAWAAFDAALEHLGRLSRGLEGLGLLGDEEMADVDVNALIRETTAARAAGSSTLALDLEPAAPVVMARRGDLARAIDALLVNAQEASPPAGRVRVRTRLFPEEGRVTVEIEDEGPGFAAEARQRGFDPLVTTRGARGRGLGVTVARLVAFAHGGSLALEDRPEGGARAVISLPVG
jgi:signal transduction histidine kinase